MDFTIFYVRLSRTIALTECVQSVDVLSNTISIFLKNLPFRLDNFTNDNNNNNNNNTAEAAYKTCIKYLFIHY